MPSGRSTTTRAPPGPTSCVWPLTGPPRRRCRRSGQSRVTRGLRRSRGAIPGTACHRSVPELPDDLGVAGHARPERHELQAVRTGLEAAGGPRLNVDGVELVDVDDLVVELHPAGAVEDDVDLLGLLVAVAERLSLVRAQPLVAEARALEPELLAREAGLARLPQTRLGRHVLDVAQVADRVAHARES